MKNALKSTFLLIICSILSISTFAQCSDVFISEYIEGNADNDAIELFNPTNSSIDLTDYTIEIYENGSISPTLAIKLTNEFIPAKGTFLLTGLNATDQRLLVNADLKSADLKFTGNDAVALQKSNRFLDVFGEIGFDPGNGWPFVNALGQTIGTFNITLIRNVDITEGYVSVLDPFNTNAEWSSPADMAVFDSVASHTFLGCSSRPVIFPPCSELIISEYLQNPGDDQALELFNPLNVDVNIADYQIHIFEDGSNVATHIFGLSGLILKDDVYVIANKASNDLTITDEADALFDSLNFSGNDAIGLYKISYNGFVDYFGVVGDNPVGGGWQDAQGQIVTVGSSLVREMDGVRGHTISTVFNADQWEVLPGLDHGLGIHDNNCNSCRKRTRVIDTTICKGDSVFVLGAYVKNTIDINLDTTKAWDGCDSITAIKVIVDSNCGPIALAPCQDIFISEYVQSFASNQAIELYNPTNQSINLNDYELHIFDDGGNNSI